MLRQECLEFSFLWSEFGSNGRKFMDGRYPIWFSSDSIETLLINTMKACETYKGANALELSFDFGGTVLSWFFIRADFEMLPARYPLKLRGGRIDTNWNRETAKPPDEVESKSGIIALTRIGAHCLDVANRSRALQSIWYDCITQGIILSKSWVHSSPGRVQD